MEFKFIDMVDIKKMYYDFELMKCDIDQDVLLREFSVVDN